MPAVSLKRNLGVVLLIMFGLGNILGAGIYVLVGKIAGEAGYYAPVSFLVASVIAAFSAFSYSELAARFPDAGGEVVYLEEAFGIHALSMSVGVLIAAAGMLSSATIAKGFTGYVQVFWDLPSTGILVTAMVTLAAVATWGVKESLLIAAGFTVIEIIGLLIVIVPAAMDPVRWSEVLVHWPIEFRAAALSGILIGAFLAFYAFIGFEDMVNLAEEAKNPQRSMPVAIMVALFASAAFYALTVWAALAFMSPVQLETSNAPLADAYQRITGNSPVLLTLIAIFAVINGALIQIIMVSRLLYGMGKRSTVFRPFSVVNRRTRTPLVSTVTAASIVLLLAIWLPVRALAEYTSGLVLVVFVLVNGALIKVKQMKPSEPGVYSVPFWVPVTGALVTVSLILYIGLAKMAA